MDCKSPTHKAYRDAVEGFYIQTWMAHRDLSKLMTGAPADAKDSEEKGTSLIDQMPRIDEVIERLNFGKRELATATTKVDQHIGSGRCRFLQEVPS